MKSPPLNQRQRRILRASFTPATPRRGLLPRHLLRRERHRRPEWLGSMLGPADAELGCEQCFEQLDRYVELQLEGADADEHVAGMRAHLEGCPACAEEHASLRALVEAGG